MIETVRVLSFANGYTALPTDRLFTGQVRDLGDDRFYFFKARCYDATIGKFQVPDSIVPKADNPQALNRYAYVLNGPRRYTDPTGHMLAGDGGAGNGTYDDSNDTGNNDTSGQGDGTGTSDTPGQGDGSGTGGTIDNGTAGSTGSSDGNSTTEAGGSGGGSANDTSGVTGGGSADGSVGTSTGSGSGSGAGSNGAGSSSIGGPISVGSSSAGGSGSSPTVRAPRSNPTFSWIDDSTANLDLGSGLDTIADHFVDLGKSYVLGQMVESLTTSALSTLYPPRVVPTVLVNQFDQVILTSFPRVPQAGVSAVGKLAGALVPGMDETTGASVGRAVAPLLGVGEFVGSAAGSIIGATVFFIMTPGVAESN